MKIIEKPWGREEILVHTENYVLKRMVINSGHRMSLQYHEKKEETIYVISEDPLLVWTSKSDKDFFEVVKGEHIHIKPGDIHRFGATKLGPCVILECSTTELEDVVRLSDDYSRS